MTSASRGFSSSIRLISAVAAITVLVLLVPVGADAADKLFSLQDGNGPSIAQVDRGALRVGDGDGAITVDGEIESAPSLPENPLQASARLGNVHTIGLFSRDTELAVTSIVISNLGNVPVNAGLVTRIGNCASTSAAGPFHTYAVPPKTTTQVLFPQPMVVPEQLPETADNWCAELIAFNNSDGLADVELVGYTLDA
jgi:hypothetical protein